jgi:hypothetical protein
MFVTLRRGFAFPVADNIRTMAKGQNAQRKYDKQWWAKRPLSGYCISHKSKTNKFFKRLLHKIERKKAKSLDR